MTPRAMLLVVGLSGCCFPTLDGDAVNEAKDDCGSSWAESPSPSPERTEACARRWLAIAYGSDDPAELEFDPTPGRAEELSVTADELRAMAAHTRAARHPDADATHWAFRAEEYFQRAADHRFRLGQDMNLVDFSPLLETVLDGRALSADDLSPAPGLSWDAVVRWRLAAAVRARHGAPLDHPDLERFFYTPGAVPGTDLLPVPRSGDDEPDLTETDRANLKLLQD